MPIPVHAQAVALSRTCHLHFDAFNAQMDHLLMNPKRAGPPDLGSLERLLQQNARRVKRHGVAAMLLGTPTYTRMHQDLVGRQRKCRTRLTLLRQEIQRSGGGNDG